MDTKMSSSMGGGFSSSTAGGLEGGGRKVAARKDSRARSPVHGDPHGRTREKKTRSPAGPRTRSPLTKQVEKKFLVTVENLPPDMTRTELKELGRGFLKNKSDVLSAETFCIRSREGTKIAAGSLEFVSLEIAEFAIKKMDARKIKGQVEKLRAYIGTAVRE